MDLLLGLIVVLLLLWLIGYLGALGVLVHLLLLVVLVLLVVRIIQSAGKAGINIGKGGKDMAETKSFELGKERISLDRKVVGAIGIVFGVVILARPDVLAVLVGVYLILYGLFEFIR